MFTRPGTVAIAVSLYLFPQTFDGFAQYLDVKYYTVPSVDPSLWGKVPFAEAKTLSLHGQEARDEGARCAASGECSNAATRLDVWPDLDVLWRVLDEVYGPRPDSQ